MGKLSGKLKKKLDYEIFLKNFRKIEKNLENLGENSEIVKTVALETSPL